jgi:hypothetical protein
MKAHNLGSVAGLRGSQIKAPERSRRHRVLRMDKGQTISKSDFWTGIIGKFAGLTHKYGWQIHELARLAHIRPIHK